jgi:uncharacterized protein (DUF1330 family)
MDGTPADKSEPAMTAYLIYAVTITDPTAYGEYVKHTPRVLAQFGGRMIVRGGNPEVLEGQTFGARMVVIEFPDRASVKRFFTSPEYAKVRAIRANAGIANGVVVDGYPATDWDMALAESNQRRL